jgi:hypothetical protein
VRHLETARKNLLAYAPSRAWLAAVVALLASCHAAGPSGAALEDAPDTVLDAESDVADGAVAGDGVADAPVGDAVDTTPVTVITISTTLALGPGKLHVRLIDYNTPVCDATPGDFLIFTGEVSLPTQVTVAVPPGTWMPVAGWLDANGKLLDSSMNGDISDVLTVSTGHFAPSNLAITINTPADKGVCSAPPPNPFFTAASDYIVPFSDLGVSHLLEGIVWNGQWWMAANVEGIGHVGLGNGGKTVSGWSSVLLGDCRHLCRADTRLFCSERGPSLKWMDIDPATNNATKQGAIALDPTVHAEGIQTANGELYAALHEAGIALVPVDGATPAVQYAKGLVADAWQIAVLADGKVVVADGAAGLKVLAPLQNGKTTLLSQLALPGLSAHVALGGNTLAVGALGGGLHLVNVDTAGQLTLLGTLPAGPWPIAGVDIQGDNAFLAAGRAVLAVPIPKQPIGLLGAMSAAVTTAYMSLDVHAAGAYAYTAEYAYVRALQLDPTPPVPGPIAVQEEAAFGKSMLVGQQVAFQSWLWNPGSAPLQVKKVVVVDGTDTPLPPLQFQVQVAPQIAPGGSVKLSVAVNKSQMGPQQWKLYVETNDPARPWLESKLTESPLVRTGDVLPALAFKDKDGQLQSVQKLAGGKPLLLVLSAETCPVSFERLAAVATHVQPWLAAGKVAVVAINPTDDPQMQEVAGYKMPFPELFAVLTSPLVGGSSEVADSTLALPGQGPIPPLPLLYLVDAKGVINYARLGYEPVGLQEALTALLGP